jgi:hypothetical protein
MHRLSFLTFAALLLTSLAARADVVRYHFVPAAPGTNVALKPGPGEWRPFRGSSRCAPYLRELRPTHLVTFRHPYTGGLVTVPMALLPDTPRIEHVGSSVVFNYGSYTIEAAFFPDGSVDVIYNSGPGRRI